MTSAFLLLLTTGICAAILYLLTVFMQFLFHSAICMGCGMALLEINSAAPTDFELFAMAALMAVIAMGAVRAYRSWGAAMQRLKVA